MASLGTLEKKRERYAECKAAGICPICRKSRCKESKTYCKRHYLRMQKTSQKTMETRKNNTMLRPVSPKRYRICGRCKETMQMYHDPRIGLCKKCHDEIIRKVGVYKYFEIAKKFKSRIFTIGNNICKNCGQTLTGGRQVDYCRACQYDRRAKKLPAKAEVQNG